VKTYVLINKASGKRRIVAAESAQEACQRVGWLIGDVHVKQLSDRARLAPESREEEATHE